MDYDDIDYDEGYSMKDICKNLLEWNKWNMPIERTDKIYRQTSFSKLSFMTDYTIKNFERTYSLFNEYETIQLFSIDSIKQHTLFTCWFGSSSCKTINKRSLKYKCFTFFKR